MIAKQESLTRVLNSEGLHEPVRFQWRVTGYFTPVLLEGHHARLTKSTEKWLKTCQWPAKELEYGSTRVESMPLCSREERNKAPLDNNGRAYFAMTIQITAQLNPERIFIAQNLVELHESLFDFLFPSNGEKYPNIKGCGFRYQLPIGGFEGTNHIFSTMKLCRTDVLSKALEGAYIRGGIVAHTQLPDQFPASPIVSFIQRNLLTFKAGSRESAENFSHVSNGPDAFQTVLHDLLDNYLTLREAFKHTLAVAHDEGTTPKTIANVVTNAEIMLSSLHRLVNNIERHVGSPVPGSKSRFFLKRWIKNYFQSAEPPTVCLDTGITGFDVDRSKHMLRGKLRRYQAALGSMMSAVRLLDPSTCKKLRQVIDSTANTPDKIDLIRLYGGAWGGIPSFTRVQMLDTIDEYMKTVDDLHRKLFDHLEVIEQQIGWSIDLNSRDWCLHSAELKQKCYESDSTD